jgi:hypothetical protein
MDNELSSSAMQRILGIGKGRAQRACQDGIAVRGEKRGSYKLESVTRYCQHLRSLACGRGGEAGQTARERLGQAQADLAEAKAALMA